MIQSSLKSAACLLLVIMTLHSPATQAEEQSAPSTSVIEHKLRSRYQAGETIVRVVRPTVIDGQRRYSALYILPVEARDEHRFGDPVAEAIKARLADRWQVICVFPTFSHLPWYADHPTDLEKRQESYLLHDVLPLIEREHPVRAERAGRWLVGFSKSGWGAYSLLFRHPDRFDRAAAWDAPLMKDRPNQFGMQEIFGTDEAFAAYQLTKRLPTIRSQLGTRTRLVLTGFDNFREHHEQFHGELQRQQLPHEYRDGPKRAHIWGSGWLAEAVELLAALPD
ncbi:MAG: alpha/beta hydrolase-fold protein [Planctomycetota bacterium]